MEIVVLDAVLIISERKKSLYITGDWNFNLLEFEKHKETLTFYETMMANLLAPSITIPKRINSNEDTLVDNILTNFILPDKCSRKLSVSI